MGAQAPPTPSASRNAKALRSGRGSLLCPHVDKLGPVFQGVGIRRETGVTVPSDLTSIEDVHDRRLAEARLRESEALFRSFAQAVPNHIWSASSDGRLDWANEPTYAYGGRTADGTIGETWTDRVHPDDLLRVRERWASAIASGDTYETEFRVRRADGVYRWFLVQALPIRGLNGAVDRWIGANTDINNQKVAAEALAQLNATLERRVEERTRDRERVWSSTNDLMGTAGLDGYLKEINPAWERALGWSEATLLAQPFVDLIDSKDHAETGRVVQRLARGEAVTGFVDRLHTAAGALKTVVWDAVPDGDVFYIVGRDISEQREIEERLRQSQKMEAVGQLTGGLAHDFNNLLTGISGSLDLLQKRVAQGRVNDIDRYVIAAQGASKRAAALTHRLLAFSRRQTLDPKPTDVNRLASDMTDMIRRTVGPAVTVETVGTVGLWTALVDPHQLENALLNLAINARDAMPDGGGITIETANRWMDDRVARERDLAAGQYLSLCVSDTGTGMPPDVIARAFEPFFTTKPLGQGTGLGLSMIYGFARQSGGQVGITSAVGEGTTVCIYLPRHYGASEAWDESDAREAVLSPAAMGETVLIVDDEATVRMVSVRPGPCSGAGHIRRSC